MAVSEAVAEHDGQTGDADLQENILELASAGCEKTGALPAPRRFELPVTALVRREEFRRILERLLGEFDRVQFCFSFLSFPSIQS